MVTLTAAVSFHCRLHYAEAVLLELFRISSVAPVTPPHRATKDTTLKGYFIPKVCIGSSVFSETCISATQLHPHHQGDGDGVGHRNVGFYDSCKLGCLPEKTLSSSVAVGTSRHKRWTCQSCFAIVLRKCVEVARAEFEVVHWTLLCQRSFRWLIWLRASVKLKIR